MRSSLKKNTNMISLLTEVFDIVTDVDVAFFLPLLIGGLFGLGAAAISASSQKQTNEMSRDMMYEQRQWAIDDYNWQVRDTKELIADQRQYESPANQMKLAREAGVNPMSVLGTSSTPGVNLPDIANTAPARLQAPVTPATLAPMQSVAADFVREELASKKAETEGLELENALKRYELEDFPLAIEHRKEKRAYERRMWVLEEKITESIEKTQRITADNAAEISSLTISNLKNMVTLGNQSIERGIITNSRFGEQLDLTLSNLRQDIEDKIFYRKNAAYEASTNRMEAWNDANRTQLEHGIDLKNAETQRMSVEGNLGLRNEEIKIKQQQLEVEWQKFEEAVKMNNWSIAKDIFNGILKLGDSLIEGLAKV